ncbi:unnamed protein product [Prorocentrum cordatum]|uniref:Uncharacterized protein n=1 Tax=Prorocentrum cordatum TaxID=2364126 RepID=A0ABN9S160_9DINO|nr:unnamed protein product [Polarella glacialis]
MQRVAVRNARSTEARRPSSAARAHSPGVHTRADARASQGPRPAEQRPPPRGPLKDVQRGRCQPGEQRGAPPFVAAVNSVGPAGGGGARPWPCRRGSGDQRPASKRSGRANICISRSFQRSARTSWIGARPLPGTLSAAPEAPPDLQRGSSAKKGPAPIQQIRADLQKLTLIQIFLLRMKSPLNLRERDRGNSWTPRGLDTVPRTDSSSHRQRRKFV